MQYLVWTIINFIVQWFVMAFIIMLAGKVVAGMEATFGKALIASLLGSIVAAILAFAFQSFLAVFWWAAGIVIFIVWLLIIKYYFGTGCIGALIVAILAFIFYLFFVWLFYSFLVPLIPLP
ncbi:MAG: hypothetical protein ACFFBR_11215 [Promethearchaeota archaeon]